MKANYDENKMKENSIKVINLTGIWRVFINKLQLKGDWLFLSNFYFFLKFLLIVNWWWFLLVVTKMNKRKFAITNKVLNAPQTRHYISSWQCYKWNNNEKEIRQLQPWFQSECNPIRPIMNNLIVNISFYYFAFRV